MNYFGAALAFSFRLSCDSSDHLVRKIHRFHLDLRHFNSPWVRVEIQHGLQSHIELFALTEQVVKFYFAEYTPKRRLRQLRCRVEIVRYLENGFSGLQNTEEQYRVDFRRHIVTRDDVLCRDIQSFHPK